MGGGQAHVLRGGASTAGPDHQRWYAKAAAQSEHLRVVHTFLARLAAGFACSAGDLVTKISASELRRKFIKSALLVGRGERNSIWLNSLCSSL